MRRTIITAVASTALVLPGAALASHSGERHHRRHHEIRHRHAHIVTFGAVAASGTSGAGATGTAAPGSPASTTDETAGKVASLANGTLTIALTDGSTVSAKVTESTAIECRSTMASAASDGGPGGGAHDDENDQSDDRGHDGQSNSGPGSGRGDENEGDRGDEGAQDEAEHCTTAALVPGAVVREAELSVSSAGSVWQKVELAQ